MDMCYSYFENIGHLSKSQLSGFKKYKYSSVDTNPIAKYVMHPFWDNLIEFFPVWLAPNVITFTGFLFIIQSFLLLTFYDYNFYAASNIAPSYLPTPRWAFAMISYSIFISYTLDGIDGKQARRTRTSGPLGELFDHGLDSWTTVFIPLLLYSLFGRLDYSLPAIRLYYICCAVFINFYLPHVEKYNTGTLYLPWSYDFAMLGAVVMFFISFLFGSDIWKVTFFNSISFSQIAEIFFYLSSLAFNIPMIVRCYSYKQGESRTRSTGEALRPLIPLTIFLVVSIVWLNFSPTNIMERDPRIFCVISGNIFSNICCQLIIAQMTHSKCEIFNKLLPPLIVATIFAILFPALELLILYVLFVFTTYLHIKYGVSVVTQLCDHFGIYCFYI